MQLETIWKVDRQNPLPEYPRPQFKRESFFCLNGPWQYCINTSGELPEQYEGEIIVPFSPESYLSGVGKKLLPKEFLFYKKTFSLPEQFKLPRTLLHFGAVDHSCACYVNGKEVGRHEGGYLPFTFDISDYIKKTDNEIVLSVKDYSDGRGAQTGKQRLKRGGIWYTAQSGIWQTVWMENIAKDYIEKIYITPHFDNSKISVQVVPQGELVNLRAQVFFQGNFVAQKDFEGLSAEIELKDFFAWTPKQPNLYDLKITCQSDSIVSYFAMRKFSIEEKEGIKRACLNNEPFFFNGLLDQGYWPEGLYTAPTDEALCYDIEKMKELGFNTLRKHIKVEPMRWYYYCDKIGMLVWQDMVSGGFKYKSGVIAYLPFSGKTIKDYKYKTFARKTKASREAFINEYKQMCELLYNVPCIAVWVPFNEGWGQFDANAVAAYTKMYDTTRLVDHASGWHDQGGGDFCSRHVYFKKARFAPDKFERAVALTEFGGYGLKERGHVFNEKKTFGYKNFKNSAALTKAYQKLYKKEIIPQLKKGLCASIYTQVSDVEDEINGLLTYDRKVLKVDAQVIKDINEQLTYDDNK